MKQPKLRDSRNLITELYPINKVPRDVINKLGADIVYMMYTDVILPETTGETFLPKQ